MLFVFDLLFPAVLLVLTVLLYGQIYAILSRRFALLSKEYSSNKEEHEFSLKEAGAVKAQERSLEQESSRTVALYDITKEVCKFLNEDEIFDHFKDMLERYLDAGMVCFLKEESQLVEYSGYTVVPLEIGKKPLGYIVAEHIKDEDRDKFDILSRQVILGMKRALLYRRVQEMAITDSLTGIFTRRYFLEKLNEEFERAKRLKVSFAFLMIDVDHFKKFNDHYGHLVGDVILKEISRTVKENIRLIDLVGKYGGDEFAVILNETDKAGAEFVAQRICKTIQNNRIKAYDEELKVSVSMGIALFPSNTQTPLELIEKADKALYQAKQLGRNRVSTYSGK